MSGLCTKHGLSEPCLLCTTAGTDLSTIRNDSSKPAAFVLDQLARKGREIKYGQLSVWVMNADFEAVKAYIARNDAAARREMSVRVERSLRRLVPKVVKGSASKRQYDDCFADLMAWEALRGLSMS